MSLEIIVEIVALVLALVAAGLSLKSAPPLDWERLFKVTLATVIRGEVEASGGGAEQWWARLEAEVPYHPAGRAPVQKLQAPDLETVEVPALEGERALVAALEKHQTAAKRWAVMYQGEASKDALLSDPAELGAAYDPGTVLKPGLSWEDVANWTADVQSTLARKLSEVAVLVVGGDFAESMTQAVPHARVQAIVPAAADILGPALSATMVGAADRAVILVGDSDVQSVIQAMHADPPLRDRVLAVVSMGGETAGEWMQKNFTHTDMDTELNRATFYMDVVDVDPEDPLASDWSDQCFEQPEALPTGWCPIARIGLGPLPLARQEPVMLARALWVLLAYRLASR